MLRLLRVLLLAALTTQKVHGYAYNSSGTCNVCEDFGGADNFTPGIVATYKCVSSMDGEDIEGQDDWEGDEAAKVG
jgi:hypothetical protein